MVQKEKNVSELESSVINIKIKTPEELSEYVIINGCIVKGIYLSYRINTELKKYLTPILHQVRF